MPDATATDFVITRLFQAPRERVWKAWTTPDMLARWFGPKGVVTTVLRHELRPGGLFHARLDQPDGGRIWARILYREIVPPTRLVWEHAFGDAEGNVAPSPFGGPWPLRLLTTVDFAEEGAATRVTLRWSPIEAAPEEVQNFEEAKPGMKEGWGGSFERLDAALVATG